MWSLNFREKYNLKNAEWCFDAVLQIMDVMNVSGYVYPYIDLKLIKLEEEEAHQIADTEAAYTEYDDSNLDEEEEADVQEICKKKRTMRNVGGRISISW